MRIILPLTGAMALAACATPSRQEVAQGDPLEGVNRPLHGFNTTVEERVLAPIAERLDDTVESTDGADGSRTRRAIHHTKNFFDNLGEPKNAINATLQGKPGSAGASVSRFAINSTVGLLGVFDVAESMHIHEQDEDFGQTLGKWGAAPGPYVVVPLSGETNARDLSGDIVDGLLNPVSIPGSLIMVKRGVSAVDTLEDAQEEAAKPQSDDDYAERRRIYNARRAAEIADADRVTHEPREVVIEHKYAPGTGDDGGE